MADWITFLVAIWGAVLSTGLAVYKIFFEDRRKVKVKLKPGIFCYREVVPSGMINTLIVSFFNKGKRPITITSYGIWLPDGYQITYGLIKNVNLPGTYSDGQGENFVGDKNWIESSIREQGSTGTIKIRGYVQDISGKKHFSRTRKITI